MKSTPPVRKVIRVKKDTRPVPPADGTRRELGNLRLTIEYLQRLKEGIQPEGNA